jgi:copper chaperone CopZ
MFRRHFLQRIGFAGATGLATVAAVEAGQTKTAVYRVKGFTCVTCAVGLETLLRREKGIARAEASYPSGIVRIDFDPALVTEKTLKGFISDMGFSVAEERGR